MEGTACAALPMSAATSIAAAKTASITTASCNSRNEKTPNGASESNNTAVNLRY
jgi:hypothetical protein